MRNISSILVLRRKAREYGCTVQIKNRYRYKSDITTIYEILIMNVTLNAESYRIHLAVIKK